jgi:signal transduction histidine kinase
VHALAEPDLLEEALAELVENAIAHTQSGEIHLSAMPAGDVVAIDIADTGEGIPPEHRGLIFEPFYRTETGGNGFGLGLAIVAQAVLAMGGTIEAVEVPRGAHLSIKLPATPPGGG